MKIFVLLLIFVFAIPAAAEDGKCARQRDGTCYNDDIIKAEGGGPKSLYPHDDPPHTMLPGNIPPRAVPKIKKKIRKYPGGFVPVGEDPPECDDTDDSRDPRCRMHGAQ